MFDNILVDIKKNRCILFIGPLISALENNTRSMEAYCLRLKQKLEENNIPFDPAAKNKPYYFLSKYFHTNSEDVRSSEAQIVKEIYEKIPALYKELSVIPFNTIINFGFDQLMNKALKQAGYEFAFDYYNYRGGEKMHSKVDKEIQLVYNLFGSIDDPNSRVLTEQHQLEFLRKISSAPKLPDDIISRLKEDAAYSKSYVFLGFDFEDWPFRFLLDTLEIPKTNRSVSPKSTETIAVMTSHFYQDRFGLNFLEEEPSDFITGLIKRYNASVFKHSKGYISFVKEDGLVVEGFRQNLNPSGLSKRISFWGKDELVSGDLIPNVIAAKLKEATVYIPFISNKSINNAEFRQELEAMMERPEVLIFPVIVEICLWTDVFSELEKRASIILPGKDEVLNSSSKTSSNEDYVKMVKIINSKIR